MVWHWDLGYEKALHSGWQKELLTVWPMVMEYVMEWLTAYEMELRSDLVYVMR